jgi:hypothetical protein
MEQYTGRLQYTGTQIVLAKPITRGNYNKYQGWKLPKGENPDDDGYLVTRSDETITWIPALTFKANFHTTDHMTFGEALEAAKKGFHIARKGWKGKNMFVVYQKGYPQGIPSNVQTADAWGIHEGDLFKCEPYLQIKMVNGSHSMWVPSINDCLAEDWEVVF